MKLNVSKSCRITCLACSLVAYIGCARQPPDETTQEPHRVTVATAASSAGIQATTPVRSRAAYNSKFDHSCKDICRSPAKLGCNRAKDCEPNCRAMSSVPFCAEELQVFFKCLAFQPLEHWECAEDGTGAIRNGVCEREQASFAACLQRKQ